MFKTCALKNNVKFVDHNLEKLVSWSFAWTIRPLPGPLPSLACPRIVGPWPRIFLNSWS